VPLYGDLARDFCLLEAGYIGQLLMTASPAQRIGLCPIGAMDFEAIRPRFALDKDHVFLHAFVGGMTDERDRRAEMLALRDPRPASTATGTHREQTLVERLRADLKAKLPGYMVPAAFVELDALPLTANGKVDRSALPTPSLDGDDTQTAAGPRSATEATLVALVQELLHVHVVGIHTSFFELGGDSVTVTRLVARIRDVFGVELPLVRVFDSPTVAGIAPAIAELRAEREDPDALARALAKVDQLTEHDGAAGSAWAGPGGVTT
jgi:acyl carrier protein